MTNRIASGTLCALLLLSAVPLFGQDAGVGGAPTVGAKPDVEQNVIYGMVSGVALLMDVHRPVAPNGRGILFIPGSGWHAGGGAGPFHLKGRSPESWSSFLAPLTDAGFTVFVINHRGAPAFRHPAALHDAQRAVRFLRQEADRWGIDPERLGAMGHSSGGHLVSLLGTLPGSQLAGDPDAPDPADRQSAAVQAVVAGAPPVDFFGLTWHVSEQPADRYEGWLEAAMFAAQSVAVYLGQRCFRWVKEDENAVCDEASPLTHVSADDPPFLFVHGDRDAVVPLSHSIMLRDSLQAAGVEAQLVPVSGGGHGAFPLDSVVPWFTHHLGGGT